MENTIGEATTLDIGCMERLHGLMMFYIILGDVVSFIDDTVASDAAEVERALGSVGLEMTNVPDVYYMCKSTRRLHAATADWRDAFDRFVAKVEAMADGFGRHDDAAAMLRALSSLSPEDQAKVAESVDGAHAAACNVFGVSINISPKGPVNLVTEEPAAVRKAVETLAAEVPDEVKVSVAILVYDVAAACDMVSDAFGAYRRQAL